MGFAAALRQYTSKTKRQSEVLLQIFLVFNFLNSTRYHISVLHLRSSGQVAERLGSGLQNRVRRFESAPDLIKPLYTRCAAVFLYVYIRVMQRQIKDAFYFTKSEVRGILMLSVFILLVSAAPYIYQRIQPASTETWVTTQLIDSLDQKVEYSRRQYTPRYTDYSKSNKQYTSYPKKEKKKAKKPVEIILTDFDPNTADRQTLLSLGLPERVVGRLQNYRSKGGRFYKSQDLAKIYGIEPDLFETLEPYIQIKKQPKKDWERKEYSDVKKDSTYTRTKPSYTKKEIKPLYINKADAATFQSLRGIGPSYSKRIINFRESLGGFISIAQVGDVYGLPDSTFQAILPFLLLDENTEVQGIKINSVDKETLAAHPYISKRKAAAIIKYRDRHGDFQSADDIQKLYALTDQDKKRIIPYLDFEPNRK